MKRGSYTPEDTEGEKPTSPSDSELDSVSPVKEGKKKSNLFRSLSKRFGRGKKRRSGSASSDASKISNLKRGSGSLKVKGEISVTSKTEADDEVVDENVHYIGDDKVGKKVSLLSSLIHRGNSNKKLGRRKFDKKSNKEQTVKEESET